MSPYGRNVSLRILLVLFLGIGAGCSGTSDGGSELRPPKKDAEFIAGKTQRVYLVQPGSTETDDQLGWVSHQYLPVKEGEELVIFVRDLETRPIGFVTGSGATFQYVDDDIESLGTHDIQRSMQLLYDVEGLVRFEDKI